MAWLLDCSHLSVLAVHGADRVGFLQRLLTNDVHALVPGAGCRACLLTATAKIVADCLVLADVSTVWLIVDRTRATPLLKALEQYRFSEAVTLDDHTASLACLALHGPRSDAILTTLADKPVTLAQPFAHQMVRLNALPVRLVRVRLTADEGVLLIVDAAQAAQMRTCLSQQPGMAPMSQEAWNILRIEAGLPWWGVDMDETTLLPETGLERETVSATKGCYVGQEIVARLETYGSVSRKLMGMVCQGSLMPQPRDPILNDGVPVGELTSVCFSPTMQRPMALGYVKRPHYEAGTPVEIGNAGRMIRARLTALPFSHWRSGRTRAGGTAS